MQTSLLQPSSETEIVSFMHRNSVPAVVPFNEVRQFVSIENFLFAIIPTVIMQLADHLEVMLERAEHMSALPLLAVVANGHSNDRQTDLQGGFG